MCNAAEESVSAGYRMKKAHVIGPKKYPVTVKPTLAPWAGPSEQWMSEETYFILNGEKLGPKLAPLEGVMTRKAPEPPGDLLTQQFCFLMC